MPNRTVRVGIPPRTISHSHALAAWLALIGLILPSTMNVFIAGLNLTPGRTCIILLFLPALFTLAKRRPRLLSSDLFAIATAAWMTMAAVDTGGWSSLASAAGAETLEFIGAYLIARGFFFELAAVDTFIAVLKVLTITAVVLAVADTFSARWIVQDIVASVFNTPPHGVLYRGNLVRATSTFDHPILFGVFCSMAASLFLYSDMSVPRRIFLVAFCIAGSALSQSSAALLSLIIAFVTFSYNRLMKQYSWRWHAMTAFFAIFVLAVFVVANHPIGWFISHLTLDPVSGYFRLLIWDAALEIIHQFPLTGYGFRPFGNVILDTTIDAVWLVSALHYGVPMVALLILTNVTAFWPSGGKLKKLARDPRLSNLSQAFTLVLVIFMFTGVTVHFWNFMWIFWGLCIGIRASLREQSS